MSTLRCPVCREVTNTYGQLFVSEWAVAAHVAGKIKNARSDRIHRAWARRKVPGLEISLSVPKLAEELLWAVHEDLATESPPVAAPTQLSLVHEIEMKLHQYVKRQLQARFGVEKDSWWVEGVPLQIRQDCASRREADPARDELYAYTFLIDLKQIVEKNWSVFETDFLRVRETALSKRAFLEQLVRLNEVRNRYSHPVRAPKRGTGTFTDDFALASNVNAMMTAFCRSTL